ncbi:TIM barrel protein [Nanoarchaeota archaeon]
MVEFNHPYYPPHNRNYMVSELPEKKIEEPIFTIGEIGQTIPEIDPSGKHKHIIQTAQAAIRGGAGVLQIVMSVPHTSAGQGRPHLYGKEVRAAMKDLFKANEVLLTGVEMPTSSLTNMSGLNQEKNALDEQTRKNHLDEVKAAIEFVADVAEGGGVDILSWEFPRRIANAEWNKKIDAEGKEVNLFENYKGEEEHEQIRFVDERTGQIVAVPIGEGVLRMEDPSKPGEDSDKWHSWKWNDFIEAAKKSDAVKSGAVNVEEEARKMLIKHYLQPQIDQAEGQAEYREEQLRDAIDDPVYRIAQKKRNAGEELSEKEQKRLDYVKKQKRHIMSERRSAEEQRRRIEELKPLDNVAKGKAVKSYAEAALFAMYEQSHRKKMKRDLYVGPENGWPHSYGGHPDEYIELITSARKELAKELHEKGKHHLGREFSKKQAEEESKKHIKGCFDTGHLGMWLKHFRPDLPYKERRKKFEKWYLKQVEKLAKADVIGSIQAVDAYGGEHGHLPPGQGIYPIKEAMKIFKKHNFSGHIISEGHEEEKYNEGRIRTKAWQALGSPISSYSASPTWGQIQNGYIGRTYSPKQMFGSYTPPFGEYKPWSEIPFE